MSPPDAHLVQSTQFLTDVHTDLHAIASTAAKNDAEHCVDIDFGIPTPGMSAVQSRHATASAELTAIERDERRDAENDRHAAAERERVAKAWSDPDHVPEFAPRKSQLPVRILQGGVAAVLAAETMLLV